MTKSAARLLLTLLALFAWASSAHATTFEVTTTADQNDGCANNGCSLRDALSDANAADGNIVHVPASATPYVLGAGQFNVIRTMTVQGDGAGSTTISGDADNRIFQLNGAGKTLTITGATLSDGHQPVDGIGVATGGAIEVASGALDIQSSVLTGNVAAATTNAGRGGAINIAAGGGNSLSLTDSAVTGNQTSSDTGATSGGGIGSVGAPITLLRSSVTGNTVTKTASGSASGGGIAGALLTATNSTIAGNSVNGANSANGGGLSLASSTPGTIDVLTNTTVVGNAVSATTAAKTGGNVQANNNVEVRFAASIVAGGTAGSGSENCAVNGSGDFTSLGSNLEDRNQCSLGVGELHDTAPQLFTLGAYGGFTQALPVLFASPARDAGGACGLATDQRGLPRVAPCDIGAFEYQGVAPVASASGDRASATTGDAVGFSASATDADPGDTTTLSWAFDDGATATGPTASHAFATAGHHTATVTATDPAGLQSTAVAAVDVSLPRAPGPGPGPGPGPDRTLPGLSGLAVARSQVSYRLSETATVTFTVQRASAGRRVHGRCLKPTRANRTRPRCSRFVALRGSFTHAGKAGLNSLRFPARVGGRKLAPGAYRLVARARDAAGNRSHVARRGFTVRR